MGAVENGRHYRDGSVFGQEEGQVPGVQLGHRVQTGQVTKRKAGSLGLNALEGS